MLNINFTDNDCSSTLGTTTTSKNSPIKKVMYLNFVPQVIISMSEIAFNLACKNHEFVFRRSEIPENKSKSVYHYFFKVEETATSETKTSSSSQELPSSSTSEQLANSQSNVYTLGFSHGLQKRTKEPAPRSQDHERSDLSVFRIYPLSRSQDKGTQTDHNKTEAPLVYHKSVQCQIQENRSNEKSLEISGHKQPKSTSSTANTLTTSATKPGAVSSNQDNKMKPGEPLVATSNETDLEKCQMQFNTISKTPSHRQLTTTKCNEPMPITNRLMTSVDYSSVTTPRTNDQPCSTDIFPGTITGHSSVTTPRTNDQPCSTDTFPRTITGHSSVTTPRTNDQPCSTDTFPRTIPEHSSMTTPKTSDQTGLCDTFPVLYSPSGHQVIKPIDHEKTVAKVQVSSDFKLKDNKENHHQNIIKKLEKDIEQLQNINIYQSIVIKFLQN